MSSNFGLFQFEPQTCRRSFGVKTRGSKPEKRGFHLSMSVTAKLLIHGRYLITITARF